MNWQYQIVYTDGTTALTPIRTSDSGSTSVTETNPYPWKPVNEIKVISQRGSYKGPYGSSYLNSSVSLNSSVRMQDQRWQVYNFAPTPDRFLVEDRALDGTNSSRIILANHQSSFTHTNATYNFWMRFDTFPSSGSSSVFRRFPSTTNTPSLQCSLLPTGALRFSLNGTNRDYTANLRTGQWHMVSLVGSQNGVAKFFVDGEEIGNTSDFTGFPYGSSVSPSYVFLLGGWDGAIGYAGFYNGALSSSQIKSIYQSQKLKTVYHTVTQGVVDAAISPQTATVPAAGGSISTDLAISQNVNWTATSLVPWLSVSSAPSGSGPASVTVVAAANPTVYQRTGSVSIGGQTFSVAQAGIEATVSNEQSIFATDGGLATVYVTAGGSAQWQATSNNSWLTVAAGANGAGPGQVYIVADPYANPSQSRTGSVNVAGKTIYFTQRGFEMSISAGTAQLGSGTATREFSVVAPVSAVWNSLATESWITIEQGSTGLGNGTVRYSLAPNTSGQTRTGRVIVSGVEHTVTQLAKLLVTAQAGTGGTVSGGRAYDASSTATLTAIPASGYAFSHWTGDATGTANPLQLSVDSSKTVQANFIPTAATVGFFNNGVQSVVTNPNSFGLYDAQQMRSMALGKPVLQINPTNGNATIQFGIRQSQNLTNWSDVSISSSNVFIRNGKLEMEFPRSGNAAFYRVLGSETE